MDNSNQYSYADVSVKCMDISFTFGRRSNPKRYTEGHNVICLAWN